MMKDFEIYMKNELTKAIHYFMNCYLNNYFDDSAIKYLQFIEQDFNYRDNYKTCIKILPTNMSYEQICTFVTFILRADYYGFNLINDYCKDGTILKLLFRLDDLVNR